MEGKLAGQPLRKRRSLLAVMGSLLTATILLGLPAASSALNYPDFSSVAGLTLNGNAVKSGSVLRLTDSNPAGGEAGSAFTNKRVVDPTKSFHTNFKISMHDGSGTPADGMAFVVQRDPDGASALGGGGGDLGYSGISPSLDVEFDLYDAGGEPFVPHVSIMKNGNTANHLAAASTGLYGAPRYVWVDYSAATQKVKVYVSDMSTKPASKLVSKRINLARLLGGSSRAGFTAGTGGEYATQDVLKWKLTNP